MAYSNFIPTLWAEGVQRALERLHVFVADCNRQYEGTVDKCGQTVVIPGIGKPTIYTMLRDNASGDINGPEEVEDSSCNLVIDQIRYFDYMVGDIDKAQAKNGIMEALDAETSEALADEHDKFVAGLVADVNVSKVFASGAKTVVEGTASSGEVNILEAIDSGLQMLYENDVKTTTGIYITLPPRFYTPFRREYGLKDTDNSGIMANGKVGMYHNVTVRMSNNVLKSQTSAAGDTDNIMIRTKRAVAFVNPKIHVEAYRPEKKFADAVKGYTLFGGKVVRPKEIVNLNVKYPS